MPGAVVGKKLNLGYVGKVTRDADLIIDARVTSDTAGEAPILFGAPVFLNDDNTYRNIKTTDTTIAKFAGVAVAEVKQSTSYIDGVAQYEANQLCDVVTRGTVIVPVSGSPVAGGKVFLRYTTVGATVYTSGKVGDFEAATDTGNVELTNVRFTTGYKDANGVAEITILNKNVI